MHEKEITRLGPLAISWLYEGLSGVENEKCSVKSVLNETYPMDKLVSSQRKQLGNILIVKTMCPYIPTTMLPFGNVS